MSLRIDTCEFIIHNIHLQLSQTWTSDRYTNWTRKDGLDNSLMNLQWIQKCTNIHESFELDGCFRVVDWVSVPCSVLCGAG